MCLSNWSETTRCGVTLHAALAGDALTFVSRCACKSKGTVFALDINRWFRRCANLTSDDEHLFGAIPVGVFAVASVRRNESRAGGEHDVDYLNLNAYVSLPDYVQETGRCKGYTARQVRESNMHPVRQLADGSWVVQHKPNIVTI